MREDYYAGLEDRKFLTFEKAKAEKMKIDFDAAPPAPAPTKLGITVIDTVKVADIVKYIDWVRLVKLEIFNVTVHLNLTLVCILIAAEPFLPNVGVAWTLPESRLPEDLQRRNRRSGSQEAL